MKRNLLLGSFFIIYTYKLYNTVMLDYQVLNLKTEFKSEYLGEEVYNMLDYTFKIPDTYTYNVFEVTDEYIARPDLISYDAYGDTMYGDIICKLNGISNPFELNTGTKLVVPTADCVDDFIAIPSIKDKDDNWGPNTPKDSTPTVKTKNSKRQANEAIVGDVRFKIDKANGVIIY